MAILDGNYWFSGTSGDAPLPIEQIGQSLRFRDGNTTQFLQSNNSFTSDTTVTVSYWIKIANVNQLNIMPIVNFSGGVLLSNSFDARSGFTPNPQNQNHFFYGSAHTPEVYQDPSAWYHIVQTTGLRDDAPVNTISNNVWINGVDISGNDKVTNTNTNTVTFEIGRNVGHPGPFQGYIADFYFIDGQALEPTAFGLYDEQGVWVPREVDFTPTTPRYSDFLTAEGGGAFNNAATRAFDGSTATGSTLTSSTGFMRFAPVPAIEGITSVRAFVDTNVDIEWQGVTTNNNGTLGWQNVTGTGTISASQPMDFVTNNTSFANLRAIEITDANGTRILTNPFIWSAGQWGSAPGNYQTEASGNRTQPILAINAFNGDIMSQSQVEPPQSWWYWVQDLTGVNTLRFNYSSQSIPTEVRVNGNVAAFTLGNSGPAAGGGANNWCDVTVPANGIVNELAWVPAAGTSNTATFCVELNGAILEDGVNNSYGTNGFHLTFADPNDLGHDSSGNGNDFTPTGFNTDPVGIFSDFLFTSTTPLNVNSTDRNMNTAAGSNPATGFDGNTGLWPISTSAADNWFIFRPATALTNVTSIQFTGATNAFTLNINGTNTGQTVTPASTTAITDVTLPAGFNGTLNSIAFNNTTSATGQNCFSQLIVNGRVLVDNTGRDYDPMQDSPSQNWATLNLLNNSGAITSFPTLANANLSDNDTSISGLTASTINWNNENTEYYFEFVYSGSGNQASCAPGLRTAEPGQAATRIGANSFYYQSDGRIVNGAAANNGDPDLATGATWSTNDVVGTAFNPSNNRLRFFLNGAEQCDITITPTEPLQFGVYNDGITGVNVNYGQQDGFRFQPAGTVALQTQNLSVATIPNGTDHFRALTASGASILNVAQGNLNGYFGAAGFARGLWWIKDMDNSQQHQIGNTLTGRDTIIFCPGLPNAMDESPYIAPAGDSVAWCWSAPDSFTPTGTNGITNLSGLRNVEAGFSIVTADAAGTTGASYTHGLTEAPQFIMAKCRNNAFNWICYHEGLTGGTNTDRFLNLNDAAGEQNNGSLMFNVATAGTVVLGTNVGINSANNFVYYNWHSVPGYSSIGTYEGNNNADGTFVYTGFKPAFVMIKQLTASASWYIFDSTRNVGNPFNTDNALEADLNNDEATDPPSGTTTVDFLSNGFKQRQASGGTNSADTYSYVAFASNPFGGSNINPVPAALTGPPQIDGIVPGIGKSLRFKGGQRLTRAGMSRPAGNYTLSMWVKCAWTNTIDNNSIFGNNTSVTGYKIGNPNGSTANQLGCRDGTSLNIFDTGSRLRDPSAWYHFVFQTVGTNTTAFVNGVQHGNAVNTFSATGDVVIGSGNAANMDEAFHGYMADVYCIDGQILDPTAFGEYNDDNIWVPIDPTITDYGTNGFKLVMDPAYQTGTTLADQSGNGNDFTMSGFDTDDYFSADFDFMKDGPSQNYATYNPLPAVPTDFANSNLTETNSGTSAWEQGNGSQVITGGKWYFEATAIGADSFGIGFGDQRWDPNQNDVFTGQQVGSIGFNGANGNVHINGSALAYGNTYSVGDVVQVAADMDNDLIWFGINGTWQSSATQAEIEAGDGTNAAWNAFNANYYQFITVTSDTGGNAGWDANFGQQPFQFTQPAGFSALQTQNLPAATIADGSDHFQALTGPGSGRLLFEEAGASTGPTDPLNPISNGAALPISSSFTSAYIDWGSPLASISVQYTGSWTAQHVVLSEDGATWTDLGAQTLTGTITYTAAQNGGNNIRYIRWWNSPATTMAWAAGTTGGTPILQVAQATFADGLWLIKDRKSSGTQFQTVDSVTNAALGGDFANTMPTLSQAIAYANPALDCVAWCWNSADPATSGFNIVQYTGQNPTTTAVAHGLGVAPDLIWTQAKSGTTRNYAVYHSALGEGKWMELNSSAAAASDATMWNNQAPDATNFYVGAANTTNFSGAVYTAYCWRAVPGYSAFGSYQSNVQADGPFVYTGFRPALVITCNADQSTTVGFNPKDSTRQPNNSDTGLRLAFNQDAAETTHANEAMDFLSNGFKIRGTSDSQNAPDIDKEFVWMAWAENPFGGSNTVPVTAR